MLCDVKKLTKYKNSQYIFLQNYEVKTNLNLYFSVTNNL